MTAVGKTAIGLRKENEDCFFIDEEESLFLIADGMGGHEHGQLASQTAVQQFIHDARNQTEAFSLESMERIMEHANATVHSKQEMLQSGIMGTTLTATVRIGNEVYVGHVGDSRLYLFRKGMLRQLTMDHSYYAELLRQGHIPSLEVARSKNVLLKALGPESEVEGQFFEFDLAEGDILLWCTDGLYNLVRNEEMHEILEKYKNNLDAAQNRLMLLAEERGVKDNLTVVLYRYDGNPPKGGDVV